MFWLRNKEIKFLLYSHIYGLCRGCSRSGLDSGKVIVSIFITRLGE